LKEGGGRFVKVVLKGLFDVMMLQAAPDCSGNTFPFIFHKRKRLERKAGTMLRWNGMVPPKLFFWNGYT
jgi:hypothetical protein